MDAPNSLRVKKTYISQQVICPTRVLSLSRTLNLGCQKHVEVEIFISCIKIKEIEQHGTDPRPRGDGRRSQQVTCPTASEPGCYLSLLASLSHSRRVRMSPSLTGPFTFLNIV